MWHIVLIHIDLLLQQQYFNQPHTPISSTTQGRPVAIFCILLVLRIRYIV